MLLISRLPSLLWQDEGGDPSPPSTPAGAGVDGEEIKPSDLNAIAKEKLFARVDAAVERDDSALRSGLPPLAHFITMAVLERVRQRIRHQTGLGGGSKAQYLARAKARRGGWGEQASFARAIADLTGTSTARPPSRSKWPADANFEEPEQCIWTVLKPKDFNKQVHLGWRFAAASIARRARPRAAASRRLSRRQRTHAMWTHETSDASKKS